MNLYEKYKQLKEAKYPKSIKDVNDMLRKKGVKEKLTKGRGYYYFYGGDAAGWYESGVYVYNINDLSLDEWWEEYLRLSKN